MSDWSYSLGNGYVIVRSSSKSIHLVYSEYDENYGTIVLNNFYITEYSQSKHHIGLSGIPTTGLSASEEEVKSDVRVFYCVNVDSGKVFGPYSTEEPLIVYSPELAHWKSTKDIPNILAEQDSQLSK